MPYYIYRAHNFIDFIILQQLIKSKVQRAFNT